MTGAMQDWPLLLWKLLDHAAINHGERAITSFAPDGPVHRTDWHATHLRARKVAQAMIAAGIRPGDRVGMLAWNTHRHVELWFGLAGMGGVSHTLNPRLFPDQLVYIANHAADRVLAFDLNLLPLVEKLAPRLETIERFVVLTDAARMPASALDLHPYEEWIGAHDGDFVWRDMDERSPAGLCYTSGTTGDPKGVLYSHRSNMLHTLTAGLADTMGGGSRDTLLPIVPMFHANAWGYPYSAALGGLGLVLNGANFDAASVHRMIVDEGVTITAGVPTVWLALLAHLEATGGTLGALRKLNIGGAAAPASMIEAFERRYGIDVIHAWGMTEMSPIGTVGTLTHATAKLTPDEQLAIKGKQGRVPFGVEMKIVGDDGAEKPRDGRAFGRLLVRGPWVVDTYFGADTPTVDGVGWFDTGDVATIDANGYMQIVDRSKDVIKSGGEWISSIELENIAVGCPGIAEAAVIGVPHPRWDERPLLVCVRGPGDPASRETVLGFLGGRIARWWMPDDVVFVDAIPHTAAGKIQKTALREQFRDYRLPTAA